MSTRRRMNPRLVAAVLAASVAAAPAIAAPRIAIIIDDLGHQQRSGERAIALPGPVACAILPGTPKAQALARLADASGKEVLVHLPMQAMNDTAPAPGTLSLDMDRGDIEAIVDAAFASLPQAIGVNNHRGSLLTRQPGHMLWLMQALREREALLFIDSYTTHHSIALAVAAEAGVPAARRHVFLDDEPTPARIREEFERLKTLARHQGSAVAIGHPFAATLALLEEAIPQLAAEGIELVPVSAIVAPTATDSNFDRLARSFPDRTLEPTVSGGTAH